MTVGSEVLLVNMLFCNSQVNIDSGNCTPAKLAETGYHSLLLLLLLLLLSDSPHLDSRNGDVLVQQVHVLLQVGLRRRSLPLGTLPRTHPAPDSSSSSSSMSKSAVVRCHQVHSQLSCRKWRQHAHTCTQYTVLLLNITEKEKEKNWAIDLKNENIRFLFPVLLKIQ
jgi:hypothetical protein